MVRSAHAGRSHAGVDLERGQNVDRQGADRSSAGDHQPAVEVVCARGEGGAGGREGTDRDSSIRR